jgi:predicted ATP-dependent endonuclease of OLD family
MPDLPLQSLDIVEYRGLNGMKLEGFGRINLFVGGNNAGKTSLLEALALFSRPLDIDNWINTAWRREVKGSRIAMADTLKWMFPKKTDIAGDTGHIYIVGNGSFKGKELVAEYIEEQVASGSGGREKDILNLSDPIKTVLKLTLKAKYFSNSVPKEDQYAFYIKDDRLKYRKQAPGALLPLKVLDASAHRVESTVQDLYSAALEAESQNQNLKEDFVRLLQKIDPGVQRLELIRTGRVATRLQIKHDQTGVTPLSALGDGFRRALMIAVTIPTVRNGVLLIDELETALHVSVLRSVLSLLDWAVQEFNVQVFATTHSLDAVDAVLSALPNAKEELVGYHLSLKDGTRHAQRYSGELWERLRFERGLDIR